MQAPSKARDWQPPAAWQRITTIEAHTGGEPFRVILDGFPDLAGRTMLERRRFAKENYDHLRRALMWEPRGHADMYGGIITPPASPEADLGVLFTHNEGFSTMCGHGVIALAHVVLETGILPPSEPLTTLRIDTPAGLVTAEATIVDGHVKQVRFRNVASFALALDEEVDVAGIGSVRYDLAFGGAFYAYVRADDLGLRCAPSYYQRLIDAGRRIKQAVIESRSIVHPLEPDLGFLYGVIFTGPAESPDAHSRHVCIFADGEVDRSPTGTGVSARLAILDARGEIGTEETITIESIIGSRFTGRVAEITSCGEQRAVIPEVGGSARITGRGEFFIDPEDELGGGFFLR